MNQSRISVNIHGQNVPDKGRLFAWLMALKPAAVLVMDEPGLAHEIKDRLPQTTVIFRWNGDGGDDGEKLLRYTPVEWLDLMASKLSGDKRIMLSTTNETPLNQRVVDWHVNLIKVANERGVNLCVLNIATGNPEPEAWEIARPLLELLAIHRQHVLGLHSYAGGIITSGLIGGNPGMIAPGQWPAAVPFTRWHLGREKFLYDYLDKEKIVHPRIILSEHGFDDTSDIKSWLDTLRMTPPFQNIRGWKTLVNQWKAWWPMWSAEQAYFEQLKWADETLYKGTAVEAQLIFSYGHSSADWIQFDIADALQLQDLLVNYAKEQPQETPVTFPLTQDPRWVAAENFSGRNYDLRLQQRIDDTPGQGWVKAGEKFAYIGITGNAVWMFAKNLSGATGYISRDVLAIVPKVEPIPEAPPVPTNADLKRDVTMLETVLKLLMDKHEIMNNELAQLTAQIRLIESVRDDLSRTVA